MNREVLTNTQLLHTKFHAEHHSRTVFWHQMQINGDILTANLKNRPKPMKNRNNFEHFRKISQQNDPEALEFCYMVELYDARTQPFTHSSINQT